MDGLWFQLDGQTGAGDVLECMGLLVELYILLADICRECLVVGRVVCGLRHDDRWL